MRKGRLWRHVVFAEWGFGLGRREVEGIIQNYLSTKKIKNPFKNGVPGEGWWSGFMKRHPELRNRKPQHLQMFRAKATNQEVINHWCIECLKPALLTNEFDLLTFILYVIQVQT